MSGWLGWDWGNVPAWTGSILTSGSLIVAASAFRHSVRSKQGEQAAQVFCTVTDNGAEPGQERVVEAVNDSSISIYAITVVIPLERDAFNAPKQDLYQLKELQPKSKAEIARVALPSESPTLKLQVSAPAGPIKSYINVDLAARDLVPEIKFRDAAGVWWRRDSRGRLRRSSAREVVRSSISIRIIGGLTLTLQYDPRYRSWKIISSQNHDHGNNRER
ncbi:hypothetical protein ACIA5G_41115 [Amycolatopsis sp. NPDC051758]|uniref:hypothetical protein n=1 Tax=Amycolatopsis sp. NPDC051758 TaxID=3363935 RepID=UPI0037A63BE2